MKFPLHKVVFRTVSVWSYVTPFPTPFPQKNKCRKIGLLYINQVSDRL